MCGRYTFTETPDPNLVVLSEGQSMELVPRYNIAPSQMCLVSPMHDPVHMYYYKWGLIPSWAKDAKIGFKMINARSETLWEKPAFRQSAKSARCLVWADGFYEWKKEASGKQAYRIGLKKQGLFPLAGITATWRASGDKEILSFSIITTTPNELMEPIHDRMPVILTEETQKIWMDPTQDQENLSEILQPLPADLMHVYRVSPSVGSVKNDHKGLIEPYTPPPTLFG